MTVIIVDGEDGNVDRERTEEELSSLGKMARVFDRRIESRGKSVRHRLDPTGIGLKAQLPFKFLLTRRKKTANRHHPIFASSTIRAISGRCRSTVSFRVSRTGYRNGEPRSVRSPIAVQPNVGSSAGWRMLPCRTKRSGLASFHAFRAGFILMYLRTAASGFPALTRSNQNFSYQTSSSRQPNVRAICISPSRMKCWNQSRISNADSNK